MKTVNKTNDYYPSGESMEYDYWKEKYEKKHKVINANKILKKQGIKRRRPKTKQFHPILNIEITSKFFPKDFFEPINNKTENSKNKINNMYTKTKS